MCAAITSRRGGTSSIGIKLPSFSMQRRNRVPSEAPKKEKGPGSGAFFLYLKNWDGIRTKPSFAAWLVEQRPPNVWQTDGLLLPWVQQPVPRVSPEVFREASRTSSMRPRTLNFASSDET